MGKLSFEISISFEASTYMLDDGVRFRHLDVVWDMHFLVLWDMNFPDMWHRDADFLDNVECLLFMMMDWLMMSVLVLFLMTVVLVGVALSATEVMSTEVMSAELTLVQATLVLTLASFSLDGLFLVLSIFFCENAQKHKQGYAEEHLKFA
jgi:hypothetical protein